MGRLGGKEGKEGSGEKGGGEDEGEIVFLSLTWAVCQDGIGMSGSRCWQRLFGFSNRDCLHGWSIKTASPKVCWAFFFFFYPFYTCRSAHR